MVRKATEALEKTFSTKKTRNFYHFYTALNSIDSAINTHLLFVTFLPTLFYKTGSEFQSEQSIPGKAPIESR